MIEPQGQGQRPTLWRWRLAGQPSIPVTQSMPLAEATRDMLMDCSQTFFKTRLLPGCLHGPAGKQSADGVHRGPHWLPEDRDCDGLVDHITVFAPDGLCSRSLQLVEIASDLNLDGLGQIRIDSVPAGASDYGPALMWESATVFVGPRYAWHGSPPRLKPGETAGHQLERELSRYRTVALQPLPSAKVQALVSPMLIPASSFETGLRAAKGPSRPVRGYFRISFAEPVAGPLAFGFGAHFGLGQFRPLPATMAQEQP